MKTINRNSKVDAKYILQRIVNIETIRKPLLTFLANSIAYAHSLRPSNWNLNLDKNRGFVRFNVGQEYCVEFYENYISVLVLKASLKKSIDGKVLPIVFKGYKNKEKIESKNLDSIPDALVKVPDSIACIINYKDVLTVLPCLKKPNHDFIEFAIKSTNLLPRMYEAHSVGFVYFLSEYLGEYIPNPNYSSNKVYESVFLRMSKDDAQEAERLSDKELLEKIKYKNKIIRYEVLSERYKRDPFVSEYAKRKANGVCQDCGKLAPFKIRNTNEPFLEIHHVIPLSEGGNDSIENVIALCPNCHRKRHYG